MLLNIVINRNKILNFKKEYSILLLLIVFLLSFFYSTCIIFLNYDNLFTRKVFYFNYGNKIVANLRYLKDRRVLKDNLDFLVKDFLLGSNEGLSFNFDLNHTRLLYSFLSNNIYYVNLSKEFYDSFSVDDYYESYESFDNKINLFIASLVKTISFNYPGKIIKVITFIEGGGGYVLNE